MRTIVLVAAATILIAGCAGRGAPMSTADASAGQRWAVTSCSALTADSADEARDAFARGHDDLHELARTLQERDLRPEAAVLLEAKQTVEQAVESDAPMDELVPRLRELDTATRDAATALGQTPPPCD